MRDQLGIETNALSNYLLGIASPGEEALVQQWIGEDPSRGQWIAQLQSAANFDEPPALDLDALCMRIAHKTQMRRPDAGTATLRVRADRTPSKKWPAIVAVMCSVVLGILGWRVVTARTTAQASAHPCIYATANGQRATITLSDGSTVALNVASRLEIPGNYAAGHRTVKLTGEALFTVAHAEQNPFAVVAGSSVTRVLGTSFSVRHYTTDSAVTVAVRDGKVAVHDVVLTAMQQVHITQQLIGPVQPVDTTQFGFASGVLVLNGTPLQQAIPDLDRWYNADIRLADPRLATRHITGGFTAGALTDFAAIVELTFRDIRVVRDGRVLTLIPR